MAEQPIDRTIPLTDVTRVRQAYGRWMHKGHGGLEQLVAAYPPDKVLTAEQLLAFGNLHNALAQAVAVFHRPG